MGEFLGAMTDRQLKQIDDTKRAEVLHDMIQNELVNCCNCSDRLEALCDTPISIDNKMNTAWLDKDHIEFMRLFRVLMYQYYDTQASESAAREMEYGEK